MYTKTEVRQGMTRDELVLFARLNGYEVSSSQIERWHKKGLLPSPIHLFGGQTGSASKYPPEVTDNLLLVLTSSESKRSLDKLLMDVWIRGGSVDSDYLRNLLLNGHLKGLGKIIKWLGRTSWIEKLERLVKKSGTLSLPYVQQENVQTTITLFVNALSPGIQEELWRDDVAASLGEETSATIVDKAIGSSYLRSLDPDHQDETAEMMFEDIKRLLNIKSLQHAVSKASEEDFYRAQKDLPILELVVESSCEMAVLIDTTNPFLRFIRAISLNAYTIRNLGLVVLLRFYQDEQADQWVRGFISSFSDQIEEMRIQLDFIRHMKQHPKLKKRMHWCKYFTKCDEETLSSIRTHAEQYWNAHPELLQMAKRQN
jgi:hypothetical protein